MQKSNQQKSLEQWYAQLVEKHTPNSEMTRSLIKAFVVGGVICMMGQGVSDFGKDVLQFDMQQAAGFTAIVMIFLGAFLTALNVYDQIGKFAGAGTIVPITGFSNSIVSAAMEFRREGLVMGVGARMFVVAGPVLVYGIGSSVIVGLIRFFLGG